MPKEKKNLTIKEQKRRYRRLSISLYAAEYPAVLFPYGIMAIVNKDEWFVYNPEGWKVGLGGTIALVLVSLSTFLITKKKENPRLTDGMISLLIGWYAITFVFFLLAQINMEIYKIMAYGGIGIAAAVGLNIGSKKYEKLANQKQEEYKQAEMQRNINQASQEIEKEKENKKKKKIAID